MCVKGAANVNVAPAVFDGTKEESESKRQHEAVAGIFNGFHYENVLLSLTLLCII